MTVWRCRDFCLRANGRDEPCRDGDAADSDDRWRSPRLSVRRDCCPRMSTTTATRSTAPGQDRRAGGRPVAPGGVGDRFMSCSVVQAAPSREWPQSRQGSRAHRNSPRACSGSCAARAANEGRDAVSAATHVVAAVHRAEPSGSNTRRRDPDRAPPHVRDLPLTWASRGSDSSSGLGRRRDRADVEQRESQRAVVLASCWRHDAQRARHQLPIHPASVATSSSAADVGRHEETSKIVALLILPPARKKDSRVRRVHRSYLSTDGPPSVRSDQLGASWYAAFGVPTWGHNGRS